jgi:nicotinamidase-related amidase
MPQTTAHQKASVALILIDVINHFEYPDGDKILRQALPITPALARLKARARRARVATIYVNDKFAQWRSDMAKLVVYGTRPEGSRQVLRRTAAAGRGRLFRA